MDLFDFLVKNLHQFLAILFFKREDLIIFLNNKKICIFVRKKIVYIIFCLIIV